MKEIFFWGGGTKVPEALNRILGNLCPVNLEKGISVDGRVLHAGLLVYCGDNLECHEIGKNFENIQYKKNQNLSYSYIIKRIVDIVSTLA